MRAYERLLRYAVVHTDSAPDQDVTPSTECQWDLARMLVRELEELGLENPSVNENCIVTARLPATEGCENAPALGFIAHMDTAPCFSGRNVKPVVHENYDGGDIVLPKAGRVIRVSEFPFLADMKGETIITADGSTLLGADDKAGIAEIMTMCEELIAQKLPHGRLCIAFTPDEEVGDGIGHFDVEGFGAKFAYTVDGELAGGVEYENFNAANARIDITGVSVHPGSSLNVMENAILIAQELNGLLPPDAIPAKTSGYEGFFHLEYLSGSVSDVRMDYLIRDHDRDLFEQKKDLLRDACARVQAAHPKAKVELRLRDGYYNMKEQLAGCMHLIENAYTATRMAGLTPVTVPVRGGTDGARLSYRGLPCPNLATGSANAHGPYELASAEQMDKVVEVLKNLASIYSQYSE